MSGARPNCSRLLLLDADLRTSQRLASLLREDGFEVEVLGDGAAALARLARSPLPDVLVTELSVPVVDGATVARFALARRPDMQIVVLTCYPNLLVPTAFGAAQPALFSKPLDYPRLLELLGGTAASASAGVATASLKW